jgi:hypothetical protein
MIRKTIAAVALAAGTVAGVLALGASPASADPAANGWIAAGVYPDFASAVHACEDGALAGRWIDCQETLLGGGQTLLWVATVSGLPRG